MKSAFIDYTPTKPIPVSGLGKTHVQAYGRGTVEVLTSSSHDAHNILLYDVLYVPDAQDNLLSISCVDHIGGQVQFAHGHAFLIDKNNQIVAEGNLIKVGDIHNPPTSRAITLCDLLLLNQELSQ